MEPETGEIIVSGVVLVGTSPRLPTVALPDWLVLPVPELTREKIVYSVSLILLISQE